MSKQVGTADKLTAYYTTLADVSGAHMRRSVVRRVSVGSREIWRNNEWNTRYGQRGKGVSQPFRSRRSTFAQRQTSTGPRRDDTIRETRRNVAMAP